MWDRLDSKSEQLDMTRALQNTNLSAECLEEKGLTKSALQAADLPALDLSGLCNKDIKQSSQQTNERELPQLPVLSETLIAKVGICDFRKTHTDKKGVEHMNYYLEGRVVFTDSNEHGKRTRTSYDLMGRVEGQRNDFPDGSTRSVFQGDFDEIYSVHRKSGGITVMQKSGSDWEIIKDPQTCSAVLEREKTIFSPPKLIKES